MLNIKAKCNILPTKTARTLECIINNISSFTMSIAIKHKFRFANIAKIRIKIIKGVKCKDLFFLVNKALKTLLKMLFIYKIRLSFSFNKNSSLDKTFTNLEDLISSYTIIVVLLLKAISKKRVQFR